LQRINAAAIACRLPFGSIMGAIDPLDPNIEALTAERFGSRPSRAKTRIANIPRDQPFRIAGR
jgi:hypothetical protein